MTNRGQAFQLYRSMVVSSLLSVAPLLGCSSGNPELPGAGETELLGEAEFELSTVPSGAVCMEVIATQSGSTYRFPVTLPAVGASTSSVLVGRLPVGSGISLSANVYSVACANIASATADWTADLQTVEFRAGVLANITLTFRPLNPTRANVNFVGNITKLFVNGPASGLVMSDGTARVAGNWGSLPSGSVFTPYSAVANIDELVPPASYSAHGCLLLTDGGLRCYGYNNYGQVGPNAGANASTPVALPSPVVGVRQASVGYSHTCAVLKSGATYCWGSHYDGQLGLGSGIATSAPVPVPGLNAVDSIVAGPYGTCANQVNGGLACWGFNGYGQLGDGTTTTRYTPVTNGLLGVVSFDMSYYHSCAVRADGTLRCWGWNGYGQLGDGTTTQRLVPTVVPGISDAVQVAVGDYSTCVLRQGGSVSCWGQNSYGQLGDGTGQNRATPATVPGLSGVVSLGSGPVHACALQQDRKVLCWGNNDSGQAGLGVVTSPYKPALATVN